jgi:carbon-monoxide dehydrogenase medium subunit
VIEQRSGDLWIGAMATHHEVESSTLVARLHPVLAEVFAAIATIRIRNQATLGGNLAHADPAQDPPPMLIALGATVHVAGSHGERRLVPIESFFEDFFATVLQPWELILGVSVPAARPGSRAIYRKFLPRSADDYATVSVAVSMARDEDGRVEAIRIGLGGVGPTPIRAHAAEAALIGELPDATRRELAGGLARDVVDPLDDGRGSADYKREMTRVWVGRAIAAASA